jgi:hypothetical protein
MRVARLVCVLFSSAAFAMQGAPPMKMGLWEMSTTATMKATGKMADAMQKMGQPMGTPTTTSMKMCLTLESWQKSVGGETHPGCTRTNVVSTGQKYSLTLTCSRGSGTTTADSTTFIDSPAQIHGTIHLVSNSDNGQMISDGTSTGKFLSADCGAVRPIGSNLH